MWKHRSPKISYLLLASKSIFEIITAKTSRNRLYWPAKWLILKGAPLSYSLKLSHLDNAVYWGNDIRADKDSRFCAMSKSLPWGTISIIDESLSPIRACSWHCWDWDFREPRNHALPDGKAGAAGHCETWSGLEICGLMWALCLML